MTFWPSPPGLALYPSILSSASMRLGAGTRMTLWPWPSYKAPLCQSSWHSLRGSRGNTAECLWFMHWLSLPLVGTIIFNDLLITRVVVQVFVVPESQNGNIFIYIGVNIKTQQYSGPYRLMSSRMLRWFSWLQDQALHDLDLYLHWPLTCSPAWIGWGWDGGPALHERPSPQWCLPVLDAASTTPSAAPLGAR